MSSVPYILRQSIEMKNKNNIKKELATDMKYQPTVFYFSRTSLHVHSKRTGVSWEKRGKKLTVIFNIRPSIEHVAYLKQCNSQKDFVKYMIFFLVKGWRTVVHGPNSA